MPRYLRSALLARALAGGVHAAKRGNTWVILHDHFSVPPAEAAKRP